MRAHIDHESHFGERESECKSPVSEKDSLRRFDQSGKCEAEIRFPVREVTACAFGGALLEDLYITTGTPGSDVEPLAGRLFFTRPGAKGVMSPAFAG